VLDITPNAVDHLNYAQYYPIVVFLKSDSPTQVKEIRQKYLKTSKVRNSRRLHDSSCKLQSYYSHLFTSVVSLDSSNWFKKLKNTIDQNQKQPIWISEPPVVKLPAPVTQIRSFIKAQSNDCYTFRNPHPKPFYNAKSNYFDDNFELQLYNANLTKNQSAYDSESDYGVCEQANQFTRPQSVYSSFGEMKRIMAKNNDDNSYADFVDYEPHMNANMVRIYSDSNLFKPENYDDERNGK
jgi:hypothetical protein